ncbi:N-terminal C2 in EEIG1 and EHBP1 proteins-domain-containing protein [Cladochytrium replicatum]|nr:N-terminal C2 in EEIG1 and EHBP1 proteins-domain-containing protein [Cladochytrium replicatum]
MFAKSRKASFECSVLIAELANLPFVSGQYFVKWKLKGPTIVRGVSQRETVRMHSVVWNFPLVLEPTLTVGKDGILLPCELQLTVKQVSSLLPSIPFRDIRDRHECILTLFVQEVNNGKSSEDIGSITINLAEFARSNEVNRRILLQDSKVNSVLRVVISMSFLKGDSQFSLPPITNRHSISIENIRGVLGDPPASHSPPSRVTHSTDAHLSPFRILDTPSSDDHSADFLDQIFAHAGSGDGVDGGCGGAADVALAHPASPRNPVKGLAAAQSARVAYR